MVSGVLTYTTDGLRPAKLSVPVVSEPISGFVFKGVARSSSVWPAIPLVDVMTTSFVRLRILSTVSRKMSNRDVGRSSSSRQWTWTIAAPSCSHRYAVSAISSGVTGTCGVSFFRGTEPVGATVMMSLSMPSAGARTASIRSKGLWPPSIAPAWVAVPSLREQVARHLHVGRDGLEFRLGEFVERHPDPAVRSLDRLNRLESPEFLSLGLDETTDRRLSVRGRGRQREGARGVRPEAREESLLRRAGREVLQLRHDLLRDPAASLEGDRAARVESASGRDVRGIRSLAFQDDALPPSVRVGDRHDGHERLRIRVPRILDQLSRRPFLDDLLQVHDPDAVREDPGEGEVVGDEQVGEAFLLPQLQEQLEDFRANRHVEHRDGLVGHDELGIQDERTRDRYALSLASGELVGIAEQEVPRWSQTGIGQGLLDPRFRLGAVPAQAIHNQRLRDDVVHGVFRIQRLVRILEDDLELLPQALDLDPLETLFAQPVPDEDPTDEDRDDEREQGAAEHRDGLVAPHLGLIQPARVDVPGEHEAQVRAQIEQEDRQASEDGRGPRRRPRRRDAPEIGDEEADDQPVADVTPTAREGQMEHRRGDERGQCRRDQSGDRDDDPEEDEVRDGPGSILFPGEGVLPANRLEVRGAVARLRGLVVVEDLPRHPDEDIAPGRRDEPQDPLARRGLAASAFSHEAENLSPPDVEVDPVDRAHVFRRGLAQRREEPAALLEPDAEIAQDQVRLAGHLTSPPSEAVSWCSGGTPRSGPRRPGRGPVPGRRTAATHTCIADGSDSRPAG